MSKIVYSSFPAVLHLYYARFMCHFLHSIKLLKEPEPFQRLLVQGMVLGRTYYVQESGEIITKEQVLKKGVLLYFLYSDTQCHALEFRLFLFFLRKYAIIATIVRSTTYQKFTIVLLHFRGLPVREDDWTESD